MPRPSTYERLLRFPVPTRDAADQRGWSTGRLNTNSWIVRASNPNALGYAAAPMRHCEACGSLATEDISADTSLTQNWRGAATPGVPLFIHFPERHGPCRAALVSRTSARLTRTKKGFGKVGNDWWGGSRIILAVPPFINFPPRAAYGRPFTVSGRSAYLGGRVRQYLARPPFFASAGADARQYSKNQFIQTARTILPDIAAVHESSLPNSFLANEHRQGAFGNVRKVFGDGNECCC